MHGWHLGTWKTVSHLTCEWHSQMPHVCPIRQCSLLGLQSVSYPVVAWSFIVVGTIYVSLFVRVQRCGAVDPNQKLSIHVFPNTVTARHNYFYSSSWTWMHRHPDQSWDTIPWSTLSNSSPSLVLWAVWSSDRLRSHVDYILGNSIAAWRSLLAPLQRPVALCSTQCHIQQVQHLEERPGVSQECLSQQRLKKMFC